MDGRGGARLPHAKHPHKFPEARRPYGGAERGAVERPFSLGPRLLGALVLAGGAVGLLAIAHSAAPSDPSSRSLSPVRASSGAHLRIARQDAENARQTAQFAAQPSAQFAGSQFGARPAPKTAFAGGDAAPVWLAPNLIDQPAPLQGRPNAADAALVFSAAPTVPGFGALAHESAPASLGTAFTTRRGAGPYALSAARADGTGPLPAGRRFASLPPTPGVTPGSAPDSTLGTTPGIGIEDRHPPRTAFYDISARAVYLPNGEKLEAHSGLGPMMDKPSSLRIKMRGVTPPNVYRLQLRERLFHGVQAIRMLPEDESTMHRRNGILAHSYMLGPSGQSNGCVSFKEYPRFLNAFLRGEVERLVVVAKLDRPPRFYNGREPLIARATPARGAPERQSGRSGRQLAYAGGDKANGEETGSLAGFKSWLSSFRSEAKASPRN